MRVIWFFFCIICCKFAVEFYSILRNYTEVLRDVEAGSPVFLTKNGRGKYAILDMHDYEKTQATIRLMNEIAKGRRSGETEGWLSMEAVEESLGIAHE